MLTCRPTIYLIGGCNGVGKTTFAKEFLPHEVKFLRFYDPQKTRRTSPSRGLPMIIWKGGKVHEVPA